MKTDIVEAIRKRLLAVSPELGSDRALALASVAVEVVDERDIVGSALHVCRVCRAPRREKGK